ncbi:substrate-binding domain-containing protein [Haloferula sp. A504]|uniref:substrate-binding domain-containing protein n=1 Tax=Haloferula sp. A504 TaxID=3373601 RepID=UPI0031C3AC75|nr:substrate-binding domain-containing protein [Verrucomicrobiaceae bacterium E54]
MELFRKLSTSEQLAEHLRRQIHGGTLKGALPGVQQLVKTLGVNSVAVGKAVQQLEREGLILYQGGRKRRLIVEAARGKAATLKVGVLNFSAASAASHDILSIRQELMNAGHDVIACPKSMKDLGMNVDRVARAVRAIGVDAWVVGTGSSEILGWFKQQEIPTFGLHGRQMNIRIAGAGIRKVPVISALIERLHALGHRRIVLLTREYRRKPQLGFFERSFIEALEKQGIETGPYNVPDWDDTPAGLDRVIDSLFHTTPPTALLVSDPVTLHAVQLKLAAKGVLAPRDVSLFCNDYEPSFLWTRPEVSHIRWDHRPAVRRAVRWASNIARGREDTRKCFIEARLHEGETIGPVRSGELKW